MVAFGAVCVAGLLAAAVALAITAYRPPGRHRADSDH